MVSRLEHDLQMVGKLHMGTVRLPEGSIGTMGQASNIIAGGIFQDATDFCDPIPPVWNIA